MVVQVVVSAAGRAAAGAATRAAAGTAAKQAASAGASAAATTATRSAAGGAAEAASGAGRGAATEARSAQSARQSSSQLRESKEVSERFRADADRARGETRDMSERIRQQNQEKKTVERVKNQATKGEQGSDGQQEEQYQAKINFWSFAMMLAFAILVDVFQILMGLLVFGVVTSIITGIANTLANAAAVTVFFVWYGIKGISFFGARNLANTAISMVAEFFSAGILPAWTIMVCVTYGMEKYKESGLTKDDLMDGLKRKAMGRKADLHKRQNKEQKKLESQQPI